MRDERASLRAELRERFPSQRSQLLPALHYLHRQFGYLPDWAMEVVGWHLGVPASELYGAATSYTELRPRQPAPRTLRICAGLSCRVNGADQLLSAAASLGLEPNRAEADPSIALEETLCGFLCAVAPVVQLDGAWHGRVTPDALRDLLKAPGQ